MKTKMHGANGELISSSQVETYVTNKKATTVFPIATRNFPKVTMIVPIVSVKA